MALQAADQGRWINFEKVALLTLDQSVHSCNILSQIVRGFGIRNVRACTSVAQAREALTNATFDLMIADPAVEGDEGILLMRWLRRQERNPNRFVPIILISGYTAALESQQRLRDLDAPLLSKPVTIPHRLGQTGNSIVEAVDRQLGPRRQERLVATDMIEVMVRGQDRR